MSDLVLVDTNVLLYEHDARDREKQERARAWLAQLWRTKRGRISFQAREALGRKSCFSATPAVVRTTPSASRT
jgi:predicted nucleic acid-binding protein